MTARLAPRSAADAARARRRGDRMSNCVIAARVRQPVHGEFVSIQEWMPEHWCESVLGPRRPFDQPPTVASWSPERPQIRWPLTAHPIIPPPTRPTRPSVPLRAVPWHLSRRWHRITTYERRSVRG